MTNGVIDESSMHLVSGGLLGPYRVGSSVYRSWTGGDFSPSSRPLKVKNPPFAYTALVKQKDGSTRTVIRWHKGKPSRPPRRARVVEDHPYALTHQEIHSAPVQATLDKVNTGVVSGYYDLLGSSPTRDEWTANDMISLVGKLKESIASNDFDASVFAATSGEAIKMIAENATRIFNTVRFLKKGRYSRAIDALVGSGHGKRRNLKFVPSDANVAKHWLELQYGWRPLLSDTFQLAEFMAYQLNPPFSQTYRVSKKVRGSYANTYFAPAQATSYKRVSIIARIKEKPSWPAALGLQDPENMAYELMPWSFVVDWFIPIGSWLQARSYASKLSGTFITTSKTFEFASGVYKTRGFPNYPDFAILGDTSTTWRKYVTIRRDVQTQLTVPMPRFKTLDKALSVGHLLNALALLTTLKHSGVSIATLGRRGF